MRVTDLTFIIWKYLTDSRFRRDVKSLRYASHGYLYFAYKILEEVSILEYLRNWRDLEEILIEKGVDSRYSSMVEEMLDLLVSKGYIEYMDGKYRYSGKSMEFPKKEYEFLTKYCPYSTRWTFALVDEAKRSLLGDEESGKMGFDSQESVEIWDGMMNEAPVSFRKFALELAVKQLKNGSFFLYLGCGTGNGLFQLFDICRKHKKKIKVIAVDTSIVSLKMLMKKLQNYSNLVDIILADMSKLPFKAKFDCIFMSLSYHYIPVENRVKFLEQLKGMLKPDGPFVNYQILHYGKFKRSPIWVMNLIPGYEGYPYYDEYTTQLRKVFGTVKEYLRGIVVVCKP